MGFQRIAMAVVLALCAVALLAAGCGGDDEDGGADAPLETSELSQSEFVKEADRACAREKRAALGRMSRAGQEGGGSFADTASEILAPSLGMQADAIRALGAPDGEEQRIEAVLAEIERAQASLEANPPADISGYVKQLESASAAASEYGFAQCAASNLF